MRVVTFPSHKVAIGKVVGGDDAGDDAVVVAEAVKAADAALDSDTHFVLKTPLRVLDVNGGGGPARTTIERAVFATGCFWGAEKGFWRLPSVYSTAAAYVAESDCQVEVVQVFYDTNCIKYADLLRWFWQCHDPTQVGGQGECVPAIVCCLGVNGPSSHGIPPQAAAACSGVDRYLLCSLSNPWHHARLPHGHQ